MDYLSKKRQLEGIIFNRLSPLVNNDYVLFGLPYYKNIGDTLIWNGELEFLKKTPYHCLGTCPWDKYPENLVLAKHTNILITGGGYFGDVWRQGWEFALKGIAHYPENPIIIMPSSIHYGSQDLMRKDAEYLNRFKNLVICVRDQKSFDIASRNFKNPVVLSPDMAFFMSEKTLRKYAAIKPTKETLYFKREDKEFASECIVIPEAEYDQHDWVTMEKVLPREEKFHLWLDRSFRLARISIALMNDVQTMLYKYMYRRFLTDEGARQLAAYKKIYVTRLHAMILGMLLGREIVMLDNSYGKLSAYYETWLTDCDNIIRYNS